jgi:hypothetical protein
MYFDLRIIILLSFICFVAFLVLFLFQKENWEFILFNVFLVISLILTIIFIYKKYGDRDELTFVGFICIAIILGLGGFYLFYYGTTDKDEDGIKASVGFVYLIIAGLIFAPYTTRF